MNKIKVIVTDFIESDLNWEVKEFGKFNIDFEYYQLKGLPERDIIKQISDAEILIVNMLTINKNIINKINKCKLIIRHGIGFDNIDIEAASEKGIAVSNIPDYCVEEVAEQTVMLLLACQRKLFLQSSILKDSALKGEWDFKKINPIYKLSGKKIGIIGFGRIGSTVFRIMGNFGVDFLIEDPYLSKDKIEKFGLNMCSLENLLSESDVVTLHVPLNQETYHLIGKKQLSIMKKNAILINTSRGDVVNLYELSEALTKRMISYAGVDVYDGREPPEITHPILNNEYVIATPHLGWLSEESSWDIRYKILEDIIRYLNKEEPRFVINKNIKIKF